MKLEVIAEPSIGNRIAFKEWGRIAGGYVSTLLIEFSDPLPELLEDTGVDLARFTAALAAANQHP